MEGAATERQGLGHAWAVIFFHRDHQVAGILPREIVRTRIALLGVFGVGNLGNEGSLLAMLNGIRRKVPDADAFCICTAPDKVTADFGIPAVGLDTTPGYLWFGSKGHRPALLWRVLLKIPRELVGWYRKVRRLRQVGMVIVPGTGALDDFGMRPLQMPSQLLAWCIAARICGAKVSFVSVGAGPIHHPLSRLFMRSALRLASYRSYRDQISKDFVDSLGLDTNGDSVRPDLAFSLPRPEQVSKAEGIGKRCVGIGVMAYYGWSNSPDIGEAIYTKYIEELARFVVWLLEQGNHVRFLIGEETDTQAVDDLRTRVLQLAHTISDDNPPIAGSIESLSDLMNEISQTDIVVATRFHNVVCALMVNKPVISCGYARKNEVLLTEMGLGGFSQHVEDLDIEKLKDQFTTLAYDSAQVERRIAVKNLEYVESLEDQYEIIFARTSRENT